MSNGKLPKSASGALKIVAAHENNLKHVSLEIPHDQLVAVTGLSGSGKSSLAFDTVYAEGQRRYIETFSPYTRQFFDKVKKPAVDLIENVRPAIAIEQRTRVTSSRSTVGSMTDINDYLKILWSNLAQPVCPSCGIDLESWNAETLASKLKDFLANKRLVSFVVAARCRMPSKVRDWPHELNRLRTLGFGRFLNPETGAVELLEEIEAPTLFEDQSLLIALDRFDARSYNLKRAKESIEQAFSIGDRSCLIVSKERVDGQRKFLRLWSYDSTPRPSLPFELLEFRQQYGCKNSGIKLEKPRPALFSFNHPLGACPDCRGFGRVLAVDPRLCIPNPSLSLREKALHCWSGEGCKAEHRRLLAFCEKREIDLDRPWRELTAEQQRLIFEHKSKEFVGVKPWFKRKERKAYKMHVRVFLARYRGQFLCESCGGKRLKPAALAYQIAGIDLPQLWGMPVTQLLVWLETLRADLAAAKELSRHLDDVFKLILARVRYLEDLGLGYLTLDRQARTLSGGETQRVNLATAIGSELVSTHFVLDEPSVGLHMRDTERLNDSIRRLQARGNSVLMVEHDLDCIASADHIIQLGPETGEHGGEIVYNGPVAKWPHQSNSAIAADLSPARDFKITKFLEIKAASQRNLKGFDLKIPLGAFAVLAGVSGSGKSTLINEVLGKAYQAYQTKGLEPEKPNYVSGFEQIEQLIVIDQSPLSKTPRANIATFSGIWDVIRNRFAETQAAQDRTLSRSAFSFNVDGGRCPQCKGAGFIREDMQFLSDVYIPCEVCLGKRFQSTVLEVRYEGLNIDEVLGLSILRAAEVFKSDRSILAATETLVALGLGHLRLGHPLSELSGGEAQRLKLVPFIQQSSRGSALLIFDEPTTGLHWQDVKRLIKLLRLLQEKGHSILCVEHNPLLLLAADWIIDLGPEGGDGGGELIKEGTPDQYLNAPQRDRSLTAKYLKLFLCDTGAAAPISRPSAAPAADRNTLLIKGAKEHNLKNIDIKLPLNKVVAITGVSGSGKSTIAKDIIYSEGQRRYLDCLSPYARQFINELKKPDIGEILNIRPTVCVYQHTFQPSRLSTVGTMSEIYNFLRLLFAKVGTQYCPVHPTQSITPMAPEAMADEIKKLPCKNVRLLASVIKLKKGHHKAVFQRALASEISEVRVDGTLSKPSSFEEGLPKTKPHSIDFVIARFNPASLGLDLITEAVLQTLSISGGTVSVLADGTEFTYSLERACAICKTGFFKPDPEDLSFNSKRGVCAHCSGYGIDQKGAICAACGGARINALGRNVRLTSNQSPGLNIFQAALLTPAKLRDFLQELRLDRRSAALAEPVLKELVSRTRTLSNFGLDYLHLNRDCTTLSGGELQRLRLAAAMGSPLSGVMYIFDEPSAGLHPRDNAHVLKMFSELKHRGNSVLVIEHDSQTIEACEAVLDIGPGGGRSGGEIVFSGSLEDFITKSQSLTAQALRNELPAPANSAAPLRSNPPQLSINSGSRNNVRNLDLDLPLGSLISVCGVSGAGKSSLVHGILVETLINGKNTKNSRWKLGDCEIRSTLPIERVLQVDQTPIGKNSRSTPSSYLGIFDEIRKLYAGSIEAKARGWSWSYFSYNTGKGRCPECKGLGLIKLEMSFIAEANVLCEVCGGSRYSDEADSVLYLGVPISRALNMTFEEARLHFVNHRKIHELTRNACELGLGYLSLGQPSGTLSGGESQRIKLVSELGASRRTGTLYVLDEPTTGLHKADVYRLINVLQELVARGNTVVVIEHDRDVIERSDYIVEMGPGPAEAGGQIVYQGAPNGLTRAKSAWGETIRAENQKSALKSGDSAIKLRSAAGAS